MHHPLATPILLSLAVIVALLCSLGLLVMRDVYQRLQFGAAVASVSVALLAVAVFLEDASTQSRIKIVLMGVLLFLMNGALTHATARAARIKQRRGWATTPEEQQAAQPLETPGAGGSVP